MSFSLYGFQSIVWYKHHDILLSDHVYFFPPPHKQVLTSSYHCHHYHHSSVSICSLCHEVIWLVVSFLPPNMLSKEEQIFMLQTFYNDSIITVLRNWYENSESAPLTCKHKYHQHDKFEEHATVLDAHTPRISRPKCARTEGNIMYMAQVVMQNSEKSTVMKNSVFDYAFGVWMCNSTTSDFKTGKYFLQIIRGIRFLCPCLFMAQASIVP